MANQFEVLISGSLVYAEVVFCDSACLAFGLLGCDLLPFVVRILVFLQLASKFACSAILSCLSLDRARDQHSLLNAAIDSLSLPLLLLGLEFLLRLYFSPLAAHERLNNGRSSSHLKNG